MDYGMEQEAIEQERFEADCEQADMEAQGRAYGKRIRRMRRYLAASVAVLAGNPSGVTPELAATWAGDMAGLAGYLRGKAASFCPHSGGYPLDSIAAGNSQDPRAGQPGVRCVDCGSVVSCFPWDGVPEVISACELPGAIT